MDENNNYMYYYYNNNINNTNNNSNGMMMMMKNIPAFGNWDYVNDLPITQYFDSAARHQGGLGGGGHVSCSSSSSSSAVAAAADQYYRDNYNYSNYLGYGSQNIPVDRYMCGGAVDYRMMMNHNYCPATTANFPPAPPMTTTLQHHTTTRRKSRKMTTTTVPPPTPPHFREARGRQREDKVPNLPDHHLLHHFNAAAADAQTPDQPLTKNKMNNNNHHHSRPHPVLVDRRAPKAVDEDLYKIPSHLLHSSRRPTSSRRKTKKGFVSRCLVPLCCVV